MKKLLEFIYRGSTRLVPSDITYLLVRAIPDTVLSEDRFEDNSDFQFTELIPDQLESHVSVASLQLGQALIDDMRESGFRFYAAMIDAQIAGYLLVGTGHIPAHHNSAGAPFAGAGLELPEDAAYVFKCFVKTSVRGQKIMSRLLDYVAAQQYGNEAVTHLVTTTDWTNHAALGSFRQSGFKPVGKIAEFVFAGRHFYKLPGPVRLGGGKRASGNTDKVKNVVVFRGK